MGSVAPQGSMERTRTHPACRLVEDFRPPNEKQCGSSQAMLLLRALAIETPFVILPLPLSTNGTTPPPYLFIFTAQWPFRAEVRWAWGRRVCSAETGGCAFQLLSHRTKLWPPGKRGWRSDHRKRQEARHGITGHSVCVGRTGPVVLEAPESTCVAHSEVFHHHDNICERIHGNSEHASRQVIQVLYRWFIKRVHY